jgi:hypothetical protein
MVTMTLPVKNTYGGQIMYADGGYSPILIDNKIILGPEQLAVVGFGEYADFFEDRFNLLYNFGVDETIQIPSSIDKIETTFAETANNTIEGKVNAANGKSLRIMLQQFDSKGIPYRSWPGAPPDGKKVSEVIGIKVLQDEKEIPLHIEYDKMIWSGLSWGAAEIKQGAFDAGKSLTIQCSSAENYDLKLVANVYAVGYK